MEWMFMPLKRYADFSGRSRRMEFWMWIVLQVIVYFVFWVLLFAVGGSAIMMGANNPTAALAGGGAIMIIGLLYMVYGLAVLVPHLAVAVRRLHDTNRSGWWILAPMVPYLGVFLAGALVASSPDLAGVAGILMMVCGLAALGLVILLIVFYFMEGTKGPNKYGPDPKGQDTGQVFA